MKGVEPREAAAMTRRYNHDPKGYLRSLVMWEFCVRTGLPGPSEEMQRPRPYYKKYWTRMFPEGGDGLSLLEVTEELEGDSDDDDSTANLTSEELSDMWKQTQAETRQFDMNQRELKAEEAMRENVGASGQA